MTQIVASAVQDEFDPFLGAWSRDVPKEAAALRRCQLEKAWRLARSLSETNPFYRMRLSIPDAETAEAFARLPVTRKEDVVRDCEKHPPFGSRTVLASDDIRMIVQTSGTSGRGTEVYALDAKDEASITRTEATGFLWAGVRPGARVLLTVPVGVTAAGLWYYAALRFIGANVLSVGAYPTARKVEVVADFAPELVVGTPSYVQRLAVACTDRGLDLAASSVNTLMVAGEPYSLEWARRLERQWGATLYEQYGCTERAIAWTCPGGVVRDAGLGVLHFPPESGYYEVVDPTTGDHVGEGEHGELVVTPFGADGSPLLRYATGDRVEYVPPGGCDCGRPLAGIVAGAVTRFDDMMKVRGVNVWPATFDTAVFAVAGVADYRGRVLADDGGGEVVQIHIEPRQDAPSGLSEEVADVVKRTTGLTSVISIEPAGTFSRSVPEGFKKVKRWTDERSVK